MGKLKRWSELFDSKLNGTAIGFMTNYRKDDYGYIINVKDGNREITLRTWNKSETNIEHYMNKYIVFFFDYTKYNSKYKSITVNTPINVIQDVDNFSDQELLRKVFMKIDVQKYVDYIQSKIETINSDTLQHGVLNLLASYLDTFTNQRASTKYHHGYQHGLLVHTAQVLKLALDISKSFTDVNMDLVIAGAILHDIGKLHSYDKEGNITERERYIGYHVQNSLQLTYKYLRDYMEKHNIDDLIHIINSHHGCKEWGAITTPQTIEANIIFTADVLSASGEFNIQEFI